MKYLSLTVVGLLMVVMSGCSMFSKKTEPLPEPATNNGLSNAEKELDAATAERLSKVSASIGISYVLAQNNTETLNNNVLISELRLAKTLSGKSEEKDWVTVKKRVEAALGGGDLAKLYEKEQAEAASLRNKLKDADAKYEAEKAKKQAEYNAKLAEKEIEIRNRKMELEQERIAKTMERFTWAGIGMLSVGLLLTIISPMPILKKTGMALTVTGMVIGSVPFIGEEPWFKYVAGGSGVLMAMVFMYKSFFSKVDNQCIDINQDKS
jgi:hypothetical protein